MEKPATSPHVHRIRFEDLIYKYDETEQQIRDILQIPVNGHIQKRTKFDPEKSIRNTQLFLRSSKLQAEVQPLESILADYLYPFPYKYKYDGGKIF